MLFVACSRAPAARPQLPASYGDYRRIDNSLTFELPDTGGYLVNGAPLDTARLVQLLHKVFDERQPYLRGAFVVDNPKRPWRDIEVLASAARSAGVQLFDAERSGRITGWKVVDGGKVP